MLRRLAVIGLSALFLQVFSAQPGKTADFPDHPVRLVIPYSAGGPVDSFGRILAQGLTELWKQQVVVDNKTGASGNIGSDFVSKSPPDGYNILMNTGAVAIFPNLDVKPKIDPLRDLMPLTKLGVLPVVLIATPSLPANNLQELIALGKAKPGTLNFASPGTATSLHLAGELLKVQAQFDMTHIPYRGGAPALVDIMSGTPQLMFDPLLDVISYVQAGKLKALVINSPKRSPLLPNVPTMIESGMPDFRFELWYGLFLPPAMPPALLDQINRDVVRALALPAVRDRLEGLGVLIVGDKPADLAKSIGEEIVMWGDLIKTSGIKVE